MQQSFSSPNSSATHGFGQTGNSFAAKKRQASISKGTVSKPIDPNIYEEFRGVIDACQVPDWQKRGEALDALNKWIDDH